MAEAGQTIEGTGGMTLRIEQLEPELLVMEASYPKAAELPPEHYHPSQAEHFAILEGEVRAVIGGAESSFAAGEEFDVPAGTPHQMAASAGPTRWRWEVRPALRTADFFESLYAALNAEEYERAGEIVAAFPDEVRFKQA